MESEILTKKHVNKKKEKLKTPNKLVIFVFNRLFETTWRRTNIIWFCPPPSEMQNGRLKHKQKKKEAAKITHLMYITFVNPINLGFLEDVQDFGGRGGGQCAHPSHIFQFT